MWIGDCFFSGDPAPYATADMPSIVGIIDLVDPRTGKGLRGATLESIRKTYPEAEIVSREVALGRIDAAVLKAPWEISKARFNQLGGVLPPCRCSYREDDDTSSFHVSERLVGSVVVWCVRIGSRFFELRDSEEKSHEALVGACLALIDTTDRRLQTAVASPVDRKGGQVHAGLAAGPGTQPGGSSVDGASGAASGAISPTRAARRLNEHHWSKTAGFYGRGSLGGRYFRARVKAGRLQVKAGEDDPWVDVDLATASFVDSNERPIFL